MYAIRVETQSRLSRHFLLSVWLSSVEWVYIWKLCLLLTYCPDILFSQTSKNQIKVDLVDENFTELKGEIAGPPDTPYEGERKDADCVFLNTSLSQTWNTVSDCKDIYRMLLKIYFSEMLCHTCQWSELRKCTEKNPFLFLLLHDFLSFLVL